MERNGQAEKKEPLPPRGREVEVLGALLRWNAAIPDVALLLTPEDFYQDAHRTIYRAILDLFGDGKPADTVTVANRIGMQGEQAIANIGGYRYLADLWDVIPTGANAVWYAKEIKDKSILRQLIHAGQEIANDAQDPHGPADSILEEAGRKVFAIATGQAVATYAVADLADDSLAAYDARARGEVPAGIRMGWVDLDEIAALNNGDLIIAGARTSVGKTSFGLNVVLNVAAQGYPVFIASLEQGRREIVDRMLCTEAQVSLHQFRRGRLAADEIARVIEAKKTMFSCQVHIDDSPSQRMLRIMANARRLKMRYGIRLAVIDYLQLIEPENRRDARHEQVGQISKRLKCMARDLDIPVLALAQLNRNAENHEAPRLADLRESGSQEQDADTVILLHRDKTGDDRDLIDVIVAKQRNGPTGKTQLYFRKKCTRFENLQPES